MQVEEKAAVQPVQEAGTPARKSFRLLRCVRFWTWPLLPLSLLLVQLADSAPERTEQLYSHLKENGYKTRILHRDVNKSKK